MLKVLIDRSASYRMSTIKHLFIRLSVHSFLPCQQRILRTRQVFPSDQPAAVLHYTPKLLTVALILCQQCPQARCEMFHKYCCDLKTHT